MVSPGSFLASTTFRLLAWYAVVFVTSVAILLGIVYWITVASLDQQVDESLQRETDVLADLYRERGRESLVRAIQIRVAELRPPRRYYLLQDPDGERIAGNLPPMEPREGPIELPVPVLTREPGAFPGDASEAYPVAARGRLLDDGEFLLVAENRFRAIKAREAILQAFGWGVAIALLLAAGGGVALGAGFLRRIEDINRTTRSIMDGDLSRRVPMQRGDDEMEKLAANLNAMLDRIQGLMESLKRVSDDIAHDLRTPLSRLRHRLEEARSLMDTRSQPVIERAIADVDAILHTFSALLRIAQIESGARRSAFSPTQLEQIVSTVMEAYAAVAEDRGQKLEAQVGPVPAIRGDRELLTQLLANLVENAIRHCPEGTAIRMRLSQEAGAAVLSVSDTGPGIPAAEHDKVLRRFYRLEASRTTPGSGLGLSLVKAVVDLHEATIELRDSGPGLAVVIRFPPQPASA